MEKIVEDDENDALVGEEDAPLDPYSLMSWYDAANSHGYEDEGGENLVNNKPELWLLLIFI